MTSHGSMVQGYFIWTIRMYSFGFLDAFISTLLAFIRAYHIYSLAILVDSFIFITESFFASSRD
jgi:hypothetical protein